MLPGMRHLLGASAVLSLLCFGCGNGAGGGGGGGDDQPMIDGGGTPDVAVPAGYTRLIGRSWTLSAGQTDIYRCVRLTIPTDTYITNIIAQAPAGTHHTVLSIAGANGTSGPDGEQDCGVGTLGMVMLYASGVGTDPLDFPADVGIKVAAGTQIHLNLHLFNATDSQMSGDSAILVKTSPTPPATLAEMVFAGTFLLRIPSDNQPHSFSYSCTAQQPYTLFALWPHMHQIAIHQKVEWTHGTTTTAIHDKAFTFSEQSYYPQTPTIQVAQGDKIKVTCTYKNNTGQEVTFGDSSNKEMCFSGLYRYPAQNAGLFQCTEFPNGAPGL